MTLEVRLLCDLEGLKAWKEAARKVTKSGKVPSMIWASMIAKETSLVGLYALMMRTPDSSTQYRTRKT